MNFDMSLRPSVRLSVCLSIHYHQPQEKKAMEEALDKMVSVKMETQREHDLLLEQLAEAAKGGQVADIKASRVGEISAGNEDEPPRHF